MELKLAIERLAPRRMRPASHHGRIAQKADQKSRQIFRTDLTSSKSDLGSNIRRWSVRSGRATFHERTGVTAILPRQ
jgi:hypothetical protein